MSDGVVILGAGLAGLSAAFHLRKGFEVFEASDRAGGCPDGYARQLPDLDDKAVREMVEGLLPGNPKGQKADAAINSEGGMQTLAGALVQRVKAVSLGQRAVEIDTQRRAVIFNTGYTAWYDGLISTIPLPELVGIIRDAPGDIADAVAVPGPGSNDAVAGITDYLGSKGIISIGSRGGCKRGTCDPFKEGIEAAMAIKVIS